MTEPELVQAIVSNFTEIAAVHKEFQGLHKHAEDMMLKAAVEFGHTGTPSMEVWEAAKVYVEGSTALTLKRGALLKKAIELSMEGYEKYGSKK